ncbi:MAG: ferric reductase-like transmembrane domain-containing protein [Candidatus Paceibacterota bacterium]|jgi:predicted ferric reductase
MKKYLIYGIFLVNIFIILFFWWQSSHSLFGFGNYGILTALGRISGLLAVFFVLIQFVLIGRSIWIERIFGLDKLTRVHHLNSFLSIFFIIFHPILVTLGYGVANQKSFLGQMSDFIFNYENVFGAFIGLLIFIGIVIVSLSIVRLKFKYESWYYVHIFTYLAILLAFGHQMEIGGDFLNSDMFGYYWSLLYLVVFGNLIVFRFLRPVFLLYRHRFYISKVEKENPFVVSIYISGKNMDKFHALPGQFIIVRFLNKKFIWQAHPFSISNVVEENQIRITVKNSGDFTSEIQNILPNTFVLIDGPYGIFTEKAANLKKFLFIAGGIGITPIRAMIEGLTQKNADIVLIYGAKKENEFVFKKELEELSGKNDFPIHYVVSDDSSFVGLKGQVTEAMVEKLVPDFKEREVYICGPTPMMIGLKKSLTLAGTNEKNIHFEIFSLY